MVHCLAGWGRSIGRYDDTYQSFIHTYHKIRDRNAIELSKFEEQQRADEIEAIALLEANFIWVNNLGENCAIYKKRK